MSQSERDTRAGTAGYGNIIDSQAGGTMIGDPNFSQRVTRITQRALGATAGVAPEHMFDFLEQFGLVSNEWEARLGKVIHNLAQENGLDEDGVRRDYATKAAAFLEVAKSHGFQPVMPDTPLDSLAQGMVIGWTSSATSFATGRGTTYGRTQAPGEGLLSMTYVKGRVGGKEINGESVPEELHASAPAKAAKVSVLIKNGAGQWVADAAMQAPLAETRIHVAYDHPQTGERKRYETTPLVTAYFLPDAGDPRGIMNELEGVYKTINNLSLTQGTRQVRDTRL